MAPYFPLMSDEISHLRGDKLVEMRQQPYESEDVLQTLLEKYPSLLAGEQSSELMQVGEGALDHSAEAAQAGSATCLLAFDLRSNAATAKLVAMRIGVITAVSEHPIRPLPGPAHLTRHGGDLVEQ